MDEKCKSKHSKCVTEEVKISDFDSHWNSQFLTASLKDWMNLIRDQNVKAKSIQEFTRDSKMIPQLSDISMLSPFVSSILYKWCQQLQQPPGVPYRALEIYEKYMTVSIHNYFVSHCRKISSKSRMLSKSHLEEILTKLRHQSLLHLVSCLQISSKLENGYKVVTVSDAAALLSQADRPCDKSTILNSEVNILVTLKHNVNYSPISDYVDTFFCHLVMILKRKPTTQKNSLLLSVIDQIYQVSIVYLRAIYFELQELVFLMLRNLNERQNGNPAHENRRTVHELRNDKMLMSAGAISAATFLIKPNFAVFVMKELHLRTGAHPSDIAVVSSVLVTYLEPDVGCG